MIDKLREQYGYSRKHAIRLRNARTGSAVVPPCAKEVRPVLRQHGGPVATNGLAGRGLRIGSHGVIETLSLQAKACFEHLGMVLQITHQRQHGCRRARRLIDHGHRTLCTCHANERTFSPRQQSTTHTEFLVLDVGIKLEGRHITWRGRHPSAFKAEVNFLVVTLAAEVVVRACSWLPVHATFRRNGLGKLTPCQRRDESKTSIHVRRAHAVYALQERDASQTQPQVTQRAIARTAHRLNHAKHTNGGGVRV